jgi:hypothetical protein
MGNPRRRKIRKHMVGRAFAKRSASGSLAGEIDNFIKENGFSTNSVNGIRCDIDNIMLRELYGEGGVNGAGVQLEGGRGANLDNSTFFHGQVMDLGANPLIIDNGIIGGAAGIGVRKTTETLGVTGSAVDHKAIVVFILPNLKTLVFLDRMMTYSQEGFILSLLDGAQAISLLLLFLVRLH